MQESELIRLAYEARRRAYVPYSHFGVGAALETEEGRVFLGCNIENASYTPTICAERTAIFKAVSEGYRRFRQIAIVGGPCTEIENMAVNEPGAETGKKAAGASGAETGKKTAGASGTETGELAADANLSDTAEKIAVSGLCGENGDIEPSTPDYCPPCGVCRQVMAEFCEPKTFRILLARSLVDYQVFTLEELLPLHFGPGDLL